MNPVLQDFRLVLLICLDTKQAGERKVIETEN